MTTTRMCRPSRTAFVPFLKIKRFFLHHRRCFGRIFSSFRPLLVVVQVLPPHGLVGLGTYSSAAAVEAREKRLAYTYM